MHLAAQALRPVLETDVAAEVEPDPPLDEPGPKAAPARLLDRRPALLGPDQMQKELLLARRIFSSVQITETLPVSFERAPYFTALVASSWKASPSATAARAPR